MISSYEPSSHHHENRNRWAVLVGVNHYDDNLSFGQLTACVSDATKLGEHLVAGGFDLRRIHLLIDQEMQEKCPSYENILTKLEVVAKATEEEDLLLFYFSGHGQVDAETGKAYLIPRNGKGAALRRTAIAIQDVKEIILNAKAKQKIIVLDACHSGADSGIKASRSMSSGFIENVFTQAEGLAIISSCTEGQFSYEWPEKQCSVFTYYFLEALRGHADRATKGYVTVQDVNWHVVNGVKDWAAEHSVSQTPRLNYLVEGDIPITYYDIQNVTGDLSSTNGGALAIHTFKPALVSARTYFTAIQKIAEDALTLFIQQSLPWSFQCDLITQFFYQLTQPTIANIGPMDDVQLNSFMIKYHYIIKQVTQLASDIHDYGHIRQTRAKQQNIELAASALLQEIKDALTLIDELEIGAVSSEREETSEPALEPYIGDIEAIREGRVHQKLADQLAVLGVHPGKQAEPEDILGRYNRVPLHALPLYTSEDEEVSAYVFKHYKALDSLSENLCDMYVVTTQFRNSEDAFDFIRQFHVIQQSKSPPRISTIPGIFFWDNAGGSEYISFGENPSLADIRKLLRIIFDKISYYPTIESVAHAREEIEGHMTHMTKESTSEAIAPQSLGRVQQQSLCERREPTVGIITTLPKEHIAMEVLLENVQEFSVPGEGASRRYTIGEIPLVHGGMRTVVLALLPNMGTTAAATRAVRLLEHFSQVKDIVMVGIAGGVPNPAKPDEHVRLGDIVVSNQYGIIQYDFIKKTREGVVYRPLPHPPSAQLLLAVRYLEAGAMKGEHPWNILISQGMKQLHLTRPARAMDVLISTTEPGNVVSHPKDPKRKAGEPRIFIGPIASANTLLKDAVLRDDLRDRFGVKAIEMEAAGVASASWDVGAGYLVVRGICDYCDDSKNDLWQEYAAVVAAAYTHALLASIPDVHK